MERQLMEQELFLSQKQKVGVKVVNCSKNKKDDSISDIKENLPSVLGDVQERYVPSHMPMVIPKTANGFPEMVAFGALKQTRDLNKPSKDSAKKDKFHENTSKIEAMSLEEIKAKQLELKKLLPKELVQKWTTKEHSSDVVSVNSLALEASQVTKVVPDLAKVTSEDELMQGLDSLHGEDAKKVEWMHAVQDRKCNEACYTRFNFNGEIVSHEDDKCHELSALYHHGKEPDKAGYSMEELVLLARSSVDSQRAMALRIWTNVLQKNQFATYNGEEHIPSSELDVPKIGMILRISMDAKHNTVLDASIEAMHAFLVPQSNNVNDSIDNFDVYRGHELLPLNVHLHENDVSRSFLLNIEDIQHGDKSDMELLQMDPVAGMLRMQLHVRIHFLLLHRNGLSDANIKMLFELLQVFVKHSKAAAQKVIKETDILNTVQTYFCGYEHKGINGVYAVAIDFIRGLCQMHVDFLKQVIELGIVETCQGFLALREFCPNLLRVQNATLSLYRVAFSYGILVDSIMYLYPLMQSSNVFGNDTAPKNEWDGKLLISKYNMMQAIIPYSKSYDGIQRILQRFTSEACSLLLSSFRNDTFTKGTNDLASMLHFLASVIFHDLPLPESEHSMLEQVVSKSKVLLASNAYQSRSLLNLHYSALRLAYYALPSMLKSVESAYAPYCNVQLENISDFENNSKNMHATGSRNMIRYQYLVLAILKSCNPEIQVSNNSIRFAGTRLLSRVPCGDEGLARNILLHIILDIDHPSADFGTSENGASIVGDYLLCLRSAYFQLLGEVNPPDFTMSLQLIQFNPSMSNLPLPIDWMYLPLSKMEITSQEAAARVYAATLWLTRPFSAESMCDEFIIRSFFHILYVFLSDPSILVDTQLHFELNASIDQYIKVLPYASKQFIPWMESSIVHSSPSSNITSLTDFVQAFLENYISVSYGNPIYAKAISIFLQSTFPSSIRRLILSTLCQSHLLPTITFPPAIADWQNLQPNIEHNTKLLDIYVTILLQPSSCHMYHFAVHVLSMYIFQSKSPIEDSNAWQRQEYLIRILSSVSETTKSHLLSYESTSINATLSTQILPNRVQSIRNISRLPNFIVNSLPKF